MDYHIHICLECGETSPECDGLISDCYYPKRMICAPCEQSFKNYESEALGEF